MSKEIANCPNCGILLKGGMFSAQYFMLKKEKVDIINYFHDTKVESYCTKCGVALFEKYNRVLQNEIQEVSKKFLDLMKFMPVVTLQNPLKWEYEVVGIVTGQSTTGTGVLSEFSSSFTDLLGLQSNRYNQKLKNGEELCFTQIRKQALNMGANAVIALDIDYSEVGGDKGMLMVCMAGTAILLKNNNVLRKAEKLNELVIAHNKLIELESLLIRE
jgi:uncharacterized protein YbjQ (UPF0145 family)